MTGTTGDDGVVTFAMVQNVYYHVDFVKVSESINTELNLYPSGNSYPVPITAIEPVNQQKYYNASFNTGAVNNSYSYINVRFIDSSTGTTQTAISILNTTKTSAFTYSVVGSVAASNVDQTYTFRSKAGDSYYVTLSTSTGSKTVNQTRIITIPGRLLDLKLENSDYYGYIALIFIFLVAQVGGARRSRDVAVITSIVALFFSYVGWLPTTALLLQGAILFAALYYARGSEDRSR
jgi:hypothetical protein